MILDVVICTYNPRSDFLQRTVDSLKKQSLAVDEWSFTIVDNSSDPPVDQKYVNWHPNGKIVVESKLGLTSARVCGIENTNSELILFVDDDNVLATNYLEETKRIAESRPYLGAFGASQIVPEYEEQPNEQVSKHVRKLALREISTSLWSNDPRDGSDPWGAGLVARRNVALAFVDLVTNDPQRLDLGRKGNDLNSAEDNEFSWIACELGYGKGIFSCLSMKHLMSSGRIQPEYIIRISEGHAFSRTLITYLHQNDFKKFDDRYGAKFSYKPVMSTKQKIKFLAARILSIVPGTFPHKVRYAHYCGFNRAIKKIATLSKNKTQL